MIRSIIFLSLCALIIISCGNSSDDAQAEPIVRPVKVITVGKNNATGFHSFTGLAKAQQEASLSFKVGGTINSIAVKVGDRVSKGQTLATVDATDYQINYNQTVANVHSSKAQIENAQAQLESAKSNFLTSQSNYNRFEKLYETNSISLSDFEQAKSSYLGAEASYKAAKTQVEAALAANESSETMVLSASNQINYTRMKAPFAGVITTINVEPNELVNQGSPILEINSLSNPDVEIGVPENAIAEIKANQEVTVSFNSLHDHSFKGKVHEIGYSSAGSTYPVTIRLLDDDDRIRPGMPANATFSFLDHHSSPSSLLVPPSAVGEDSKDNFVYLIESKDGSYFCKKKTIQIGQLKDAGFEILSGLNNGDLVASAGLNVLRDGMQVSLYTQTNHR